MHDSSKKIYPWESYRLELDKILTRIEELVVFWGAEKAATVYVRGPVLSWDK